MRFGVSNGVLYRTNGIMKMKRIPLEDIAKVVIIDRTAPHENRPNPIAYKVKILGKEGKTLLSFYDPSGKYAFDDTFHYVLNNHRIAIEIKRIFGSSSPHDAQ
ncbi:MAG: hypothetical protein J6328_04670 [Bacilli bacterium]|nr:hypothetical protein [Bacilli bacterium]